MEEIIKQIEFADKLLVNANKIVLILNEEKVKLYKQLEELMLKK